MMAGTAEWEDRDARSEAVASDAGCPSRAFHSVGGQLLRGRSLAQGVGERQAAEEERRHIAKGQAGFAAAERLPSVATSAAGRPAGTARPAGSAWNAGHARRQRLSACGQ